MELFLVWVVLTHPELGSYIVDFLGSLLCEKYFDKF